MRIHLPLLLACVAATPVLAEVPPAQLHVGGSAQVTAKPDRVQIDVGVSSRAPRSQDAAAQNAHQVEAVLAAVRQVAGAGAQLRTVNYSLNPDYQYHPSGTPPTLLGYSASNVVRVTLDDLDRAGPVIDAATRAGANQVQGIQFMLRDPEAVRGQALREAAARARASADLLAGALGLKVVRVLDVADNSARGGGPGPVFMARAAAAPMAEYKTPVEAGTLDVNADVALTVEVAPR
ncbi:MAG: SIMPL domain-containing protein [Proteobacteria bacterium]|nr:SIMPL domain-containing protein [Pseudomonadota bacterium]